MPARRFWITGAASLLLACGPGAMDDGTTGDGGGGVSQNTGGSGSGGETQGAGGAAHSGSGGSSSGGSPTASSGGASGGAEAAGGGVASGGTDVGSGGTEPSGGSSGNGGAPAQGCPFSGHVEYHLNGPESWPSEVVPLIVQAMDEATEYYNCYSDLTKSITVNYKPSVPTAEANVDGQLSFGSNQSYMQVATAMHEVAHTLGVGYSPWSELLQGGRWIGPNVDELMTSLPAEERDPDEYSQRDYITADSQHFWPYGLNQAAEYQSEWSLINHVRIVAAMHLDKQAYLNGDL